MLFLFQRVQRPLVIRNGQILYRNYSAAFFRSRKKPEVYISRISCFQTQTTTPKFSSTFVERYQEFFKSMTESDVVISARDTLVVAHDMCGLSWASTILLTTLCLRFMFTFPVGIYQNFVIAKLELCKIEFAEIIKELKYETAVAIKQLKLTEKEARSIYNASARKQWRLLVERENCHPLKSTLVLWVQIPAWVILSLSLRCMAYELGPDPAHSAVLSSQLAQEGMLWFPDLLVSDPTYILPAMVTLANLAIVEIQACSKTKQTRTQKIITNIVRGLALISFPIASSVPSCISLYWSWSSLLALGQNCILMLPSFRGKMGIPETPAHPDHPFRLAWENFKGKWSSRRTSFKYYKQKNYLNFDNVLLLEDESDIYSKKGLTRMRVIQQLTNVFGVYDCMDWRAFSVDGIPGLIVIRNPFTWLGQRYWIARCCYDYPRKPNFRNVDIDPVLKEVDHLWEYNIKNDPAALEKLRWITLGYHHNWDTKVYSESRRNDFPSDLNLLSQHFASALGYNNFRAEAAIVNLYHFGSTLAGHVDTSEVDLNAPLLSMSFGQSGLFLIGGTTLDTPGTAILLQSGDVVLMSREARVCYHAVPRILPALTSPWKMTNDEYSFDAIRSEFNKNLVKTVADETSWIPFENYINKVRININVRQVLPQGHTMLE